MDLLNKLLSKENLSLEEAKSLSDMFLQNEISDIKKSVVLTALKLKGETAEEIAGFALGMREHGVKIKPDNIDSIDVCGTGGDNSGTFNISTAVSILTAAAGVTVAKHGNRSISSKSGSADVLKYLGVNIELSPDKSEQVLNEIGIAFLFAPVYHPAMKHVAPVRRELATKTIFNMLGPLTNPAGTKRQLIGTFNEAAASKMAAAARYLDLERVDFICTENRYDEVTLTGNTAQFEYDNKAGFQKSILSPADFGYEHVVLSDLRGGGPEENAQILLDVFNAREPNTRTNVVCANAALALLTSSKCDNLKEAVHLAEDTLFRGKAIKKLEELKKMTNEI
ncbi:MAG: anthranilate phosphoribosyltransferase [Melioribacteraceae bacterium]|nr:MAG: anthranilate phosphoribosyltransferase [Melioribacteraceae bacterium]